MPELDYAKANVISKGPNFDFPKFGGMKKDEKARILMIEKAPTYEWTHLLQRPKIVEGVPIMKTVQRRDKTEYQAHEMDFLARPICLGDAGTISSEVGLDAKNCPMCALAKKNPDATGAPVRRFATHVIRYKTKAGTFDPLTPFNVECLVWSFNERMYGTLAALREEWEDLRMHDLMATCTNGTYQNMDINVANGAAWLEDDTRKKLVKDTYVSNRIEDLSIACGRKTELRWIESDLEKISEAWAEVAQFNRGAAKTSGSSLAEDLNSLEKDEFPTAVELEKKTAAKPAAAKPAAAEPVAAKPDADLDAMFDGIESGPKEKISDGAEELDNLESSAAAPAEEAEPEPAPVAKKAAAKPAAAASSVEDDLDALLNA